MDTFSEAWYYLNVNILVSIDQHSNIIAAAVHWNHVGAT